MRRDGRVVVDGGLSAGFAQRADTAPTHGPGNAVVVLRSGSRSLKNNGGSLPLLDVSQTSRATTTYVASAPNRRGDQSTSESFGFKRESPHYAEHDRMAVTPPIVSKVLPEVSTTTAAEPVAAG